MEHPFPRLAQRMFNTPVLITEDKAGVIVAALAERIGITQIVHANGDVIFAADQMRSTLGAETKQGRDVGYEVIERVAVIPIEGTLVNRLGCMRPYSGMTGYDGIRYNVLAALDDASVKAIALDIDSPGGEVAGCFDLVDTIRAARGTKPIWAIVNEMACSGGYAIASAADKIILPRTGLTGSIGACYMHVDYSRALKDAGIKVTFIKYGDLKTMGAGELPLDDDAKARIQARIDYVGELFIKTVCSNRKLKAAAVRGTEAAILQGDEALSLDLVDAIAAPDEAFAALVKSIN